MTDRQNCLKKLAFSIRCSKMLDQNAECNKLTAQLCVLKELFLQLLIARLQPKIQVLSFVVKCFSLHDYQHFELSLLFEYVEIDAFHFLIGSTHCLSLSLLLFVRLYYCSEKLCLLTQFFNFSHRFCS